MTISSEAVEKINKYIGLAYNFKYQKVNINQVKVKAAISKSNNNIAIIL